MANPDKYYDARTKMGAYGSEFGGRHWVADHAKATKGLPHCEKTRRSLKKKARAHANEEIREEWVEVEAGEADLIEEVAEVESPIIEQGE